MIKTNLLLVVLASAFVFTACKKDEKTTDNAAKAAEPAPGDTTAATEPATDDKEPEAVEEKAPEATSEEERKEVSDKLVEMFTKMNESVQAAKGDCAKMATDFSAVLVEFEATMAASKVMEKVPANKQWFDENYGEKVEGIMGEMMGGMGECTSDPAIQEIFESMDG